jgi:TonB family protein
VPYDGEDSFSIGYKHIMEDIPTPALENPEKRQLFEIIRKMMAKLPGQRFQNADELVTVLEGGRSVTFTTDATMAIPSMSGARLPSAPTTPLPRAAGRPTLAEPARHSVMSGLLLWLVIVGTVLGAGGFYAYKQGLIFASKGTSPDTTVATLPDSGTAAGDTTKRVDSAGGAIIAAGDTTRGDTSRTPTVRPPLAPPGTPGRIVLQGIPQGARVSIDGQQVRGTQLDLPPGVHRLTVRAAGYQTYDRQVTITPGETFTVQVNMQSSGDDRAGPCDQFGPAYNQDNLCFDTRPVPLSPTLIPVAADAPVFPRQAILMIKVSRNGTTLEARVYVPSNVEPFNNEALDMAKNLRWNPAQKNGEPVEAWVQWPFQPVRQ